MTRNLKALGIALVAMFAMSAMAAASASAAQHHFTSTSESGTTYLTAHSLGEQKLWSTTNEPEGNREFCKAANVNAAIEGEEVTEVTAEPSYGECTAFTGGSEVKEKLTTNGCHYLFTGVTEEDVTGNQTATMHLTCPAEKQIEVEVTGLNLKCLDLPGGQTLRGISTKQIRRIRTPRADRGRKDPRARIENNRSLRRRHPHRRKIRRSPDNRRFRRRSAHETRHTGPQHDTLRGRGGDSRRRERIPPLPLRSPQGAKSRGRGFTRARNRATRFAGQFRGLTAPFGAPGCLAANYLTISPL